MLKLLSFIFIVLHVLHLTYNTRRLCVWAFILAISWREQVTFQWEDHDVRFILYQHTKLDFYIFASFHYFTLKLSSCFQMGVGAIVISGYGGAAGVWKALTIHIFPQYEWVSEWLLFIANSAIFQLYHGENKLIFNEMMMTSALF